MHNVIPFAQPHGPSRLTGLRRPTCLIRAAREGQRGWRRKRDLPRLLRCDACPPVGAALARLRAEEDMLQHARKTRADHYDMQRHVLLMIAILAEMQAEKAALPSAPAFSGRGTRIQARP